MNLKTLLSCIAIAGGLCICSQAETRQPEGAWRGELDIQQNKLPLVFNFSPSDTALPSCTIDSPLQGAKGIPSEVTYCTDDSIAVEIKSIGATFQGKISPSAIKGTFRQRGFTFPLTLTKELSLEERRPQTPRPPFPYSSMDTTFTSSDSVSFAGTLTLPDNPAKGTPLVVFVTGSGPQNRDEELFDHRPFAVIADQLARNGIASFRYDDRGTGLSGGDFKTADISTFKADAYSALSFARTLNPGGKTGILGHSEGGTIAVMLGADGEPDFIISLAGAMIPGKELILQQNIRVLDKLQLSEKQLSDATKLISLVFDNIIAGKKAADIPVSRYVTENNLDVNPMVTMSVQQNLAATTGTYFPQLLSLKPAEQLKAIKCPIMAINGSKDTQVGSVENLAAVRNALPSALVKEYPGLNHLFQHAETGEMNEYINIPETISPEVLSDITAFILSL